MRWCLCWRAHSIHLGSGSSRAMVVGEMEELALVEETNESEEASASSDGPSARSPAVGWSPKGQCLRGSPEGRVPVTLLVPPNRHQT